MTDAAPNVSVIIPVYNSGDTAVAAVESVLAQGRSDIEIIVVDDGSEDRSAERLADYVAARPLWLIRLLRQANQGAAAARNAGIAASRGRFVAFLDSDDLWLPGKLDEQLAILEADPAVALVGTLTNSRASAFHQLHNGEDAYPVTYRAQLLSNRFQTSTVVIRSDVLREVGVFPVDQRYAEEGDLFLRIAHRYKTVLLNRILVDYGGGKAGFGDAGLSGNLWGMWIGELVNLRRARQRAEISGPLLRILQLYSGTKFIRRLILTRMKRLRR